MQQQTAEVDNAETAAVVAVDDREAAAKKLAAAQRNLQDAKGKQQHSLQVTASSDALPEVTKPPRWIGVPHEAVIVLVRCSCSVTTILWVKNLI